MAASCQERMVCPAYQSTYILDDSVRSYFFSRFESDSLPKRYGRVEKSNWGLVKHKSKSARLREIRTVAMKNVLPPKQEPPLSRKWKEVAQRLTAYAYHGKELTAYFYV